MSKFSRDSLGDLVFTSTIDNLATAYYLELGVPKPSTIAPIVYENDLEPIATSTPVVEAPVVTDTIVLASTTQSVRNDIPNVNSGTTTVVNIVSTSTVTNVASTTELVVSTSTREVVSTSTIDVVSTTTEVVVTTYIENIISTTTSYIVSTSTQNNVVFLGKLERKATSTDYDEFQSTAKVGNIYVANISTSTNIRPWIGRKNNGDYGKQRFVLRNLIPSKLLYFTIYTSGYIGNYSYTFTAPTSTPATFSFSSFTFPAQSSTYLATTTTKTFAINPQTSSLIFDLFVSSPTSTNHYLHPDAYRFILPTITYSTTTVISTTSTPVTRYSTSTREVVTTTPTTITSTSTVVDYATSTIIHYSTSTEVVTNTEEITVDNPYSYPYTIDPITKEVTYYIYSSNNITATSSNPLDTPCTLNLKTCKSSIHSIVGILKNYEEEHGYQEDLIYTKFYPSAYYEYDSRGVTTINIPFNGKVVATLKYGKNLYEYNSGSDTKTDCTLASSNCTLHTEVSYLHNDYLATPKIITNSIGSTTEVIKRDVWGSMINDNYNSSDVIPTKFGLTNHKWDEQSELTYAHARFLSNKNKVWLSNDPMSITGFASDYFVLNPQYQNSYSYVANNPVNNVDPDGKVVIVINGTQFFGKYTGAGRNWTSPNLMNVIKSDSNFSGQAVGYFNWDADDNHNARLKGANEFSTFVENTMKMYPGEDLNIVAHSHGGQIAAQYSQKEGGYQIRNLVTLETPVVGYKFNESKIDNHIQTYGGRMTDWVQSFGGTQLNMGYLMGGIILGAGGIKSIVPASALFSSGVGQFGLAGLKVQGAKNVDISAGLNTGLLDNHSQAHESAEIWRCYISNALLAPTKK